MSLPFHDRRDAGRQLAATFGDLKRRSDVVVFGLPRGGVPVAYEVAEAIGAPLDVYLVRKLGVPGHEELAMGAIAMGGLRVLNQDLARELGVSAAAIDEVEAREGQELARRERLYRGDRPRPDLRGKVAILVDDGLATGSTMAAAARSIRALEPARVIAAVPVASAEVCAAMRELVDEMICLETPEPFAAVGLWYDDFSPTSDAEVQTLLCRADERPSFGDDSSSGHDSSPRSRRSAA